MKRILNTVQHTLVVLSTILIFLNVFSSALPPIKVNIEIKDGKIPVVLQNDKIWVRVDNSRLDVNARVETGYAPLEVKATSGYPAFQIKVQ